MKFFDTGASSAVMIGSTTNLFGGATFGVNGSMGATRLVLSSNTSVSNLFPLGTAYVLVADGKIGAREVVVSLATPFPDYVFKPGYKLLSLSEIEQHIKQYSRLPEMPSAAQVEKNGLEVAKTTSLLVKKIEELTLHMIEMNKKIEKLEAENQVIKNHN